MSSIANTSISLSKKDLTKSRKSLIASRSIVFYHKATLAQSTIDLNNLSMPSTEMPTQVQATAEEISGSRLTIFKKNLKLVSSANGELIQGLDYLVVDNYTISLIGPYLGVGAEDGEIFVGTVSAAPMSDLTPASAKSVIKTYELAIGSSTLNLGNEYQIGLNPLEDIGDMKIWVNGILAIRGQDYNEVDSGNGYGTTIEFLSAPVTVPWQIVVDFGVRSITDLDAMDTIESLAGSINKIATDLADLAGTSVTDYFTASPSEVERRTFGDQMLGMLDLEIPIRTGFSTPVPLTIRGFTSNPTKGTMAKDEISYYRDGRFAVIRVDFQQTSAGAAGSGTYEVELPDGLIADTSLITLNNSTNGTGMGSPGTLESNFTGNLGVSGGLQGFAVLNTSNTFRVWGIWGAGTVNGWGSGQNPLSNTTVNISGWVRIPIQGWEDTTSIRDLLGL